MRELRQAPDSDSFGYEFRHVPAADAVTEEILIGVGSIFPPREITFAEPAPDVFAAEFKEGADHTGIGDRTNGAETGRARAPEEAVENGFGLVVEGVPRSYCVAVSERNLCGKEIVADAPSFLFGIAFGEGGRRKHRTAARIARRVRGQRPRRHPIQPRAAGVFYVQNGRRKSEFPERMEEKNGVRSTRDCYAHAL